MAPLKSSLARTVGKLLGVSKDTDLSLRGAVQINRVPPPLPVSATGGVTSGGITPGNGYRYHVFVSPGNLVVSQGGEIEIFAVASGGPGGSATQATQVGYCAGGGAGGIFYATSYPIQPGTHSITVGATGTTPDAEMRQPGDNSTFVDVNGPTTLTALGGGFGNYYGYLGIPGALPESPQGGPGGSSGGAGYGARPPSTVPAGQPTQNPGISNLTNYGNHGGGVGADFGGGGGGGAGGVGDDGQPDDSGDGGAGQPFPAFAAPLIAPQIPSPVRTAWTTEVGPTGLYGGGGGAGGSTNGSYPQHPAGAGGVGGGGDGANANTTAGSPAASNGLDYTGGGAGGAGNSGSQSPKGGVGGAGLVVVRYLV